MSVIRLQTCACGDNLLTTPCRALGKDPRKDVAHFASDFPDLAKDLELPQLYEPQDYFSSVMRVGSPGLHLWTHYDAVSVLWTFSNTSIVGQKPACSLWYGIDKFLIRWTMRLCKSRVPNAWFCFPRRMRTHCTSRETSPRFWILTIQT